MKEIYGIGAFGFVPYLSEDVFKQTKYANIKTRAGKAAYLLMLGEKAPKPQIKEGVYEARGALKWISEMLQEEEKSHEK